MSMEKATSLHGQWLSDRNRSGPKYPGGFDGFFREQLKLTDAAIEAAATYNPLSPDNPESTCVGRPTPAAIVSSIGYMMRFDLDNRDEEIIIQSEWYNEIRIVYMDGRQHPDSLETFATGYSIGHWDGDTLVIDTRNFDSHVSPYQIGVPSGPKKHVIETYRLIEDGASLEMSFTLNDPDYLTEPLHHSRIMTYTPQLTMYASDCDPESTAQFLK